MAGHFINGGKISKMAGHFINGGKFKNGRTILKVTGIF